MHPMSSSLHRLAFCAAGLAVAALGIAGALWFQETAQSSGKARAMFLAPMVGVIDACIEQPPARGTVPASLARRCVADEGSAGALVEASLQSLSQAGAQATKYEVGYTLPIPLLKLFRQEPTGWAIDDAMVQRLVNTVRDVQRPVIMYLFSTHFEAHAPIENELAGDEANMAQTRDGALGTDSYYDDHIYNWSFVSTRNTLTARRVQAVQAVLNATCRLPEQDRAKIRGVTLLGELHHLFPNFQSGMGFDAPYRITDYSSASVQGFREYLAQRFRRIDRLNRFLGSDYASFDDVHPPFKDIRTEPLKRFTEHIDAFAHGSLPISGWAHISDRTPDYTPRVRVYLNGELLGQAFVELGRQDVLAARPELGDANTGWRLDLDFRRLTPGMHTLNLFLESRPGQLVSMGARQIAIMDRHQSTPQDQPQQPLPWTAPSRTAQNATFHIDFPRDRAAFYYNPLVPLWHTFRAQQVTRYLAFFDELVGESCLAPVPRYTHQIIPFTNPSWDATRFAIQDSLRPHGSMRLGVSLYGEPTYGRSFAHWLRRSGQSRYGITEFHPLKALDPQGLAQVFDTHAQQGAEFLSFFLEPEWEGERVPRGHNIFSFDPLNPQFGSDVLYRSTQEALRR